MVTRFFGRVSLFGLDLKAPPKTNDMMNLRSPIESDRRHQFAARDDRLCCRETDGAGGERVDGP